MSTHDAEPKPRRVSFRDLRANLAALLKEAGQGAEMVITNRGREIARLVPPRSREPRPLGLLKGNIWIAADFDETPAEIVDAMEGLERPD